MNKQNRYSEQDRARLLAEIKKGQNEGLNISQSCRKAGIGVGTFYDWTRGPYPRNRQPLISKPKYTKPTNKILNILGYNIPDEYKTVLIKHVMRGSS